MKALISTLFAIGLFIQPTISNAYIVPVENWWLQTDSLGGLRQSTTNPNYYFAVSQNTTWDINAVYEPIEGYRVATTAEGQSVFNQPNSSLQHTYFNQGGWSGYNWEGQTRYFFRFSDSNVTNAYKHAGNYDEYFVGFNSNTNFFAGLILIKEPEPVVPESLADVPVSIGLAGLLMIPLLFQNRKR